MAGIKFDITGDNSNVLDAFRGVQDGVRRTQQVVESSGKSIEDVFDKIKSLANTAFVGFTAKEFITTLAQVRGEFQQLEVAFNTMLGSKEKADALMGQLVELAATTPFDLKGVASGAKQLLAYGLEAEKVTDTMRRLGDIAAGLGLQIGDLAWLYGTTLTQGRMYAEDLNQFTGRGIPMIAELAKQFGVAESEVKQLVTDGKVGFPQVEQAIKNLTDEGGKFGGLMEAQSHTIIGQISNIKDSIDMAFNELGQQSEGVINTVLAGVSSAVENWRQIGKVILETIAVYGTYKAAVMTVTAVHAVQATGIAALTTAEKIHYGWLVMCEKAQRLLNATMLANPYVLLVTAVGALGVSMYNLYTSLDDTDKKARELQAEIDRLKESTNKNNKTIQEYLPIAKNAKESTEKRKEAIDKLKQAYPEYFKSLTIETARNYDVADAVAASNEEYRKRLALMAKLARQRYEEAKANYEKNRPKNGQAPAMMGGTTGYSQSSMSAQELANVKQLEKAWKVAEDAVKDYDKTINSSSKNKTGSSTETKNTNTYTDKDAKKRARELERLARERESAQEQLNNDLLSLEQKNIDDGIALQKEGTKKRLAEIDNDYKKRIAEIERQEAEFKEKNKEAGLQGLGADGLTNEQQNALQEAADNATKERERQTQEVYAAEAQAMRDYLKEYGTFQQQKLAIAEEYAEKIKNAQSEGERLSLTAERDKAVQQVEINAIKQNIDWGSVFGDFGTMFRDQLQPTIDRLRQIANSDTFKQSSLDEQQVLYELINKLENANAAWDSDIFKRVSDDMKAYQEAMRGYAAAVDKARIAEEKLANAQSTLDAAKRGGLSQEVINAAQVAVGEAQEAFNTASEEVKGFGTQVQETTASLNSSATEAKAMFDGLAEGLRGLSSGSLQGIGQGIMSLDKLFGGNITKDAGNALAKGFQSLLGKDSEAAKTLSAALGDSGLAGEIISAILGMLDMLAEGGIGGIASNLADTVLGSVNGILSDIFSGGIIAKPVKSLVDGLGGILDTVTFGGFSSWGNNVAETKETIERLTVRNEALIDSLDRLNDTMKEANGAAESVAAAEQAKEYQQEVNENYRDIAAAQAHYQGKHHSWSKYFNDWLEKVGLFDGLDSVVGNKAASLLGIDDKDLETWRKMNEIAGFEIKSRSDFLSITPEQMAEMLADVDIRGLIESIGKGGYGAKMLDTLEDYADQAGKIEEIENTLRETLTQISFDSMYDSFIDTLMDMDASADDFADDFSEYMMRALLSNQVGTMFKDRLQEWYTAFAEAMEDGDLASGELDSLRNEWDKIVADAMAERDKLAEATGYDSMSSSASQQQASKGYSTTMSQDTGEALYGRFTAMYEADLKIIAIFTDAVTTISTLSSVATDCNTELRNILNQQVITNSHLENIAKYTKNILDFGNKLDMIVTNTKNI